MTDTAKAAALHDTIASVAQSLLGDALKDGRVNITINVTVLTGSTLKVRPEKAKEKADGTEAQDSPSSIDAIDG